MPLAWLLSGAARVQPLLQSPPITSRGRSLPGCRVATRVALTKWGACWPKVGVASRSCAHLVILPSVCQAISHFFLLPLVLPLYLASVVVGPVVRFWVYAGQPPLVPAPLPFFVSFGLADARLCSCFPLLFASTTVPCDLSPSHQSSCRLH